MVLTVDYLKRFVSTLEVISVDLKKWCETFINNHYTYKNFTKKKKILGINIFNTWHVRIHDKI